MRTLRLAYRVNLIGVVLLTTFSFTVRAAFGDCLHAHEPFMPTVSTIAGSGLPGSDDGEALKQAAFIEPSGIAVGPDGSIYVADASADNIRKIAHGVVTTIAGDAEHGASKQQRLGGYVDGPALKARFNEPLGIAIAKDGTLYVADAQNGAIRRIKSGVVSTLTKGLDYPRALAFDDDDILFVGDQGSGVRTVSLTDGTLSPLDSISPIKERPVCGLSVSGRGPDRILAYTDETALHVKEGTTERDIAFTAPVEPVYEGELLGSACSVLILDRDNVIVSDIHDNAVKLVRLALAEPVGEPPMVRYMTTGRNVAALRVGGYADGPSSQALSDTPRSLARARDGSVVFADSGNRRVRSIKGLDLRGPVSNGPDGSLAITSMPRQSYRVAFVGNSFSFTGAMWPDSIPGQIEQNLISEHAKGELKLCPAITAYRLSGSSVSDAADFVSTYYGDGEADLVIFLVDAYNLEKDIAKLQKTMPNLTDTNYFAPSNLATGWRESVPARLRALRDLLAKNDTRLVLVTVPDGRSISNLENLRNDTLPVYLRNFYSDTAPNLFTRKLAEEVDNLFVSTGVPTITLVKPLTLEEEGATRVPLFGTQDMHPTPAGNIVIGKLIGNALDRLSPWHDQR